MNNLLYIVFFKDKNYRIYYPKKNQNLSDVRIMISKLFEKEGIKESDVEKDFYIDVSELPHLICHSHLELVDGKIKINEKNLLLSKIGNIREKRNELLEELDTEYLIAVRRKQPDLLKEVEFKSQFLRNVPQTIDKNRLNTFTKIIKYNPFRNIYKVKIVDKGSGYINPPIIRIESPNGRFFGFQAELSPVIKNGQLIDVIIKNAGCGYDTVPIITIGEPENGRRAIVSAELFNIVDI